MLDVRETRSEKLMLWHDEHREYYNKFIAKVTDQKRKGLAGLFRMIGEVNAHFQDEVIENIQGSGQKTLELSRDQGMNLVRKLADGVDSGDDYCSAVTYWIKFGDGFEQMFLMLDEIRNNKIKALFSLGALPMLMRKYEAILIDASINSGMRTAEQWLSYEHDFNASNPHSKISLSPFLQQEDTPSKGKEEKTSILPDNNSVTIPEMNNEVPGAEKRLIAVMHCGESIGTKIIQFLRTYLSAKHTGTDAARMMIALQESDIISVDNMDFKAMYNLVYALKIPKLVSYHQAQEKYSPMLAGLSKHAEGKLLPKYEKDRKEIDGIKTSLMGLLHPTLN